MGCDVLLTDLEEVLPLLVANVDTNAPSACGSTSGSGAPSSWGRARCQVLQWGVDDPSPIAAEAGPFDYILGSDVVYSERLVPILMDTIRALAQPK